jgi:hypothetical protein
MNNKPVAYGMLTFCKNCGEQNPYSAKTLTDEEIAQAKLEATKYKGIYDNQGNGIGQTKYVNDRLFVEAILRKASEK